MPCVSSTSPAEQEPDLTLDAGGGQRLSQIARIAQMAAFGRRTWWFGRLRNPARVDHVTMRVALSRAAVRVSGTATSGDAVDPTSRGTGLSALPPPVPPGVCLVRREEEVRRAGRRERALRRDAAVAPGRARPRRGYVAESRDHHACGVL